MAITKEIIFYSLSVVVVCGFGLIGTSGYPLLITYLSIYILYLITSVLIEKFEGEDDE